MFPLLSVIWLIFGAAIGSFLNVVVVRMPKEEPITGRSHCPVCKARLGYLELIPLASFFFLKGKCKNCGANISWRYPILEAVTAFLFLGLWLAINPITIIEYFFFFESLILAGFAVAVFVIDLEHYLILDRLVFPTAFVFFVLNLVQDLILRQNFAATLQGIIGTFLGFLPFYLIWAFSKGRLMGFGDVKLMLPLGLALGWPNIVVGLFLAVGMGSLVGILLLILGKKTFKSALPFGCFLVVGAVFGQIYGDFLINWYLSILGI